MISFRDRTDSDRSSASRESMADHFCWVDDLIGAQFARRLRAPELLGRHADRIGLVTPPGRPPPAALGHASVLRLVELTLDPGADVPRPLHLSQALVEHELGDAGCGCDFRFQNVGLTRK